MRQRISRVKPLPVIQPSPQPKPEVYCVEFRSKGGPRQQAKRKYARVLAESKQDARSRALAPEGYTFLQAVSVPEMARAQARYGRKLRMQVVAAYGGKCQCPGGCPVRLFEFLNIDHVNNNGTADRKAKGASTGFYRWLLKNGCPKDDYRLLCYNCNMARAKQQDKRCPHEHRLSRKGDVTK